MKLIKNFLSSKPLPSILLILNIISAIAVYSLRYSWVFINTTLKINGFTMGILCSIILNALCLTVLNALNLYKVQKNEKPISETRVYRIIISVAFILSAIFTVAATVYFVLSSSKESFGVTANYFRNSLFETAFYILVPALAIFMPAVNKKTARIITILVTVGVVGFGYFSLFPPSSYEITSNPSVIDNGSEYSVVFSTSSAGTGFIEYKYEGKSYKLFDENGGRLDASSKIHNIPVPYEHLKNNTYTVGSTRVIEEYSYGSRLGKTVISEEYSFKVNESKNQTYLVLSDWHTLIDDAYAAVNHAGDYDAVILLGDASPGVDFENEVVRNIVEFSGEVSKGTKPVIYARGNHETRGAYAGKLLSALGLREFYYNTKIGDISFIVLDSGEDKDDSHPEYGGMDNYNQYRKKNIDWLKTLENSDEKLIVLSHSWQINDVETELSEEGWKEINRLGARLLLSGHSHQCRFVGEGSDREKELTSKYPNIAAYMDGGKTDKDFIASKMTITDTNIKLEAFSLNGEKVFDENITW